MNKKRAVLGLVSLGLAAYLGTVYYVDSEDNALTEKNLAAFSTLDQTSLDYQAMSILADKGCSYCHTPNSEMPFYANMPIANTLMQADIDSGLKHFDISVLFDDVQKGLPTSEVALAKIERVVSDETMPPPLYLTMHWASAMSEEEKGTLLKWVRESRAERHANSPVTEERKGDVIQPIYTVHQTDASKVALGEVLYHDTRLSGDNTISCASCHGIETGGVDNMVASVGIHGLVGGINSPTVFNSANNRLQFWDGRAKDLQDQAGGPPFNPIEMGSESWEQVISKLQEDPEIMAMFDQAYKGTVTGETITHAIAEFEKTLMTPNSRFDQYLMGNTAAINEQEKRGFELFNQHKCSTCHAGETLGGDTFETMGIKEDYFASREGAMTEADFGRFNVTGLEHDKYKFKVPTLRNVELTMPYFHDGAALTLDKAIEDMARYQVGVTLSESEVADIKAFLLTLTGEYQGKSLSPTQG